MWHLEYAGIDTAPQDEDAQVLKTAMVDTTNISKSRANNKSIDISLMGKGSIKDDINLYCIW